MARRKNLSTTLVLQSKRLRRSVWLFPCICGILLLLLTVLQISGSSVGEYHHALYGPAKDSRLLANEPQLIRSDEWLVTTQLTIAQKAAGYPRVNHNILYGRDMSLIGDAPYKDWSMVFRPQNLVFFILPLGYAFAFKWWLLLFLVVVSCYFVVLRFFPSKRLLAALIGSGVGLSPFLFWWYQTLTLAPIFYGFFILLLSMRIINNEAVPFLKGNWRKHSQAIHAIALSYVLIAFALVLYPPFQIPVAAGSLVFLVGYYIDRYRSPKQLISSRSLRTLGIFAASGIMTAVVLFAFIHTRSNVISALEHTVYPGNRIIEGGGSPVLNLFSTFLQPQLEHESLAVHYYTNQSEASSFLLLLPFLIIPGFLLIILEYRQKRRINWSLFAVQLGIVLFLSNLYWPALQPFYRLFLLDKVPHARLFIGLGFIGLLQLLLIMKSLFDLKLLQKRVVVLAAVYSLTCLAALLHAGHLIQTLYPGFIHDPWMITLFAVLFVAIIFCFLSRRFVLGATILLVFSAGSVFHIQPLYRGLGLLDSNRVFQAIERDSKPGDTWATLDAIYFENFGAMSNRNSLSGIQLYPDLPFWRQAEGPKADYVYNRYAHVLFTSHSPYNDAVHLAAPDRMTVRFACTPFIKQHVQFALATRQISNECSHLIDTVAYPKITFYIYHVH